MASKTFGAFPVAEGKRSEGASASFKLVFGHAFSRFFYDFFIVLLCVSAALSQKLS